MASFGGPIPEKSPWKKTCAVDITRNPLDHSAHYWRHLAADDGEVTREAR
jgi:hypothetical protein